MSEYQVIARKFRPQTFKDVLAQESIITTLKNAIQFKKTAQAYLFCGSRGTGKTTLARILAKALNCEHPSDAEPCNQCSSCKKIISGSSLDVIEIDGASNRGIEDIRQINDTVGYAAAAGGYKIFIIDEVHMLTKEAFNALLKTLEEPPEKVKFFFATTEAHKIPATILSRCQRFNLNRIPPQKIVDKLRLISKNLQVMVEEEALLLVAQRAEGGLRDAESLFDQILAFEKGTITAESVTTILGIMPREVFFEIDLAGKNGELIKAFEIAQEIFSSGKDISYFIEGLVAHFRLILLFKIADKNSPLISLTDREKEQYEAASQFYTKEQCLNLIEYLIEAQQKLRLTSFGKTFLEITLLHVIRSHSTLPIEHLIHRLSELEEALKEDETPHEQSSEAIKIEKKIEPKKEVSSPVQPTSFPTTIQATKLSTCSSISEDPTPSLADLGIKAAPKKTTQAPKLIPTEAPAQEASSNSIESEKLERYKYDTIMHFAAIELEGKLQIK